MGKRPGGEVDKLPLHFIWLADCSRSMSQDGKIQALNQAVREAVPHMQQVDADNPSGQLLVRSLAFDNNARWHQPEPTDIHEFEWEDLSARGKTAMGAAMRKVGEALSVDNMPDRALPPVLVLVSDGQPTDKFRAGLREMMENTWCRKAVRMAISIGEDADDHVLRKFIGRSQEVDPLQANNPEALADQIQWVSTRVVQAASAPQSRKLLENQGESNEEGSGNIPAEQLNRDDSVTSKLNENDDW